MTTAGQLFGLPFSPQAKVYCNLPTAALYEEAIRRGEIRLAASGAMVAVTGRHTGRSAQDKFTVRDAASEKAIWWGDVNKPIASESFAALSKKVFDFLAQRDLFVFEGYAGADASQRINVRVVTTGAWHNVFAANMFIRETDAAKLQGFKPDFTIYHAPDCKADPAKDGTRSETFIVMNFGENCALIGGTHYAGEIKKTIFSVMNKRLPEGGVLSMHCSANYGKNKDDSALFFGLSGTGKTTISADSERVLIGDDEHGWGPDGIFNIEGGCYAKVIDLTEAKEPEIWYASHRFGTVLENVVLDDRREPDFTNVTLAENTRSAYPLTSLPPERIDLGGVAGHPKHIVFLTADAFGVLPPVARLNTQQAMYHFLSGYTAKVAGTEIGVKEPSATFSTCFGAPFLPLHPSQYAELLAEKIEKHKPKIWLVNTGWTGGPYGVGQRMKLQYTRRMVRAALHGELDKAKYRQDSIFGFEVPLHIEGVPDDVLVPRGTWADPAAYDEQAAKVAAMFVKNFDKYADSVAPEVREAGPQLAAKP